MTAHDQEQFQYFDRVRYRDAEDPVVVAYAWPKVDYALERISLKAEPRILDLACGNGVFSYHLSKMGAFMVGLDLSSQLLAENRYGRRVCGDARALPFDDGSFDVVFEANLVHHVAHPTSVIAQMKRVSRKYLVFVEPNRLNPLMFLFSLAVPAERRGLRSPVRLLRKLAEGSGLHRRSVLTTGMISQNNTPAFLVPFLKKFDREIWWGEYTVLIAEK